MKTEQKAKAYDETLEQAQKELAACGSINCDAARQIFRLFPQLRESEDERIRKILIRIVKCACGKYGIKYKGDEITEEKLIAYLEKQKEKKPADFPTTDEEVNEFLETHSKVEVPEKYKTPDFVFSKQEYESYPIISKDTTSVKPAEWSEEDEDMLNSCISSIEEAKENRYAYKETDGDTSYDHEIAWLKSLRNRVGKEFLQPHWKPSEEQIGALNYAYCELFKREDVGHNILGPLQILLDNLKKLM